MMSASRDILTAGVNDNGGQFTAGQQHRSSKIEVALTRLPWAKRIHER
jgi:hypothetical protein